MQPASQANREAKDDLFYGQVVVIMSRWFLILAGVVLAVWQAERISQLVLPIAFMIILMGMNFFLHGRYLMKQPVNAMLVYVSSAVDLLIILLIVLFSTVGTGTGFHSNFFVFLYPALLAFALVFSPKVTAAYAGLALAAYLGVVIVVSGFGDLVAQKDLLMRLITLGATAGLGTYFWRIQRSRRDDSAGSRAALLLDVEALATQPVAAR